MKKYAVIDVGSNSVRLLFVADGKVLYKRLNTTRLGEGLAQSRQLKAEAIERSAQAVCDFCTVAKAEGAEIVMVFATAAVRSASNGQAFVARVKELCGLTVDVISGETEAEIGILGALGEKDGAVIDIGGASTEIVVREKGSHIYKKSIDVGVVRIKDNFERRQAEIHLASQEYAKQFSDMPTQKTLCAIGGTATTLAAQVLGLEEYNSDVITGSEITGAQLRALSNKLFGMSVEEIALLPCMPKGRADVLSGGAEWLATLMETLGIERLVISDRDNLEGYALKRGFKL